MQRYEKRKQEKNIKYFKGTHLFDRAQLVLFGTLRSWMRSFGVKEEKEGSVCVG